jgi:hypothetical protein
MHELHMFSAGSANDNFNHHLWLKGASLFIPQINNLLKQNTNYIQPIIPVEYFENDYIELGNILENNKSDKSTAHNYHILYSFVFDKIGRHNKLNVLEIGLGTNDPSLVSSMGETGRPGASLYAFREYLPNSTIYGADIDKNILFQSERINTSYVDQLDIQTFKNMQTAFGNVKYDIIIDDGLHSIGANLNTLLFALSNLNVNGWIIIEDIHIIENWKSVDFILSCNQTLKTYTINAKGGYLYVINKVL